MEPTPRDARDDEAFGSRRRRDDVRAEPRTEDTRAIRTDPAYDDSAAREKFGGANLGAAFFGWLVAVGMTVLLTGLAAVVATVLGYTGNLTTTPSEQDAGTIGLVAAIVLLVVLLIAYYSGGYVAGRMSRFDGGRQGFVVWLIGLVLTVVAGVLGYLAGDQYNLFSRVDFPSLTIPKDSLSIGAAVTAVVVLVVTLLAAVAGGKVGQRYHRRVDRHL